MIHVNKAIFAPIMINKEYLSHYKAILKLGIPLVVGQLGIILVGFVDTLMVGKYSTPALGAASFVNSLFAFATMLCLGFSYGLTPLIGALYTQNKIKKMGETLKNGILINSIFGIFVITMMSIGYFNLEHLNQPAELMPLIYPYYLIMLCSLVFVIIFNVFRQFFDGITNTALSMWILMISNVINIGFNYLLIFGKHGFPEMGLTGAGISTLGSRCFMAIAIVFVFFTFKAYRRHRESLINSKLKLVRMFKIFNTSWPISLQLGTETGLFNFSAVMIGWLGTICLASYQIILTLGMLGFMVYYGFGASVTIRTANFMGLRDIKNVKLTAKCGLHIQLAMASITSLFFFIFASDIINIFTSDKAVYIATSMLVLPMILYQFVDAIQINYSNALRGTAHVMPIMWIALFAYIIVGIPTSYIMGFTFGLGTVGIFLAFSISLLVAATLFMYQFFRRVKHIERITN